MTSHAITKRPSALLIHAGSAPVDATLRALQDEADLRVAPINQINSQARQKLHFVIVDLFQFEEADLGLLSNWRLSIRGLVMPLILIVDDASRRTVLQRGLNEGANLLRRPIQKAALKELFALLRAASEARARSARPQARQAHYASFPAQADGLAAGDAILDDYFAGDGLNRRLDPIELTTRSTGVIDCIGRTGLSDWITAVRQHHDSTYQHCLLVTGTLLAIGHHFRMRRSDLGRLAVGGLLHDIGKADIPLEILDKPTRLSPHEITVMQSHPLAGVERLADMAGVTPEILTLVRDHHELLDGSGYPNKLKGDQIGDFVRLLTIADIYAALMERRAYKAPMPADDVIAIMSGMHETIDQALFAAISPVLKDVRPQKP